MIESSLDRMALEECYEDTGGGVTKHQSHHGIDASTEHFLWKDANIEQQD